MKPQVLGAVNSPLADHRPEAAITQLQATEILELQEYAKSFEESVGLLVSAVNANEDLFRN